ncbi:hypothetical protein L3Q82_017322 [Scortum barcoo]|uniref:Uncharacterized protein n=1 Tax=Scortum barcoo TaxID=214431 RepID=A0ACB8VKK3_9TELE|nr:hypothetical protein L3Q82_017322 [Scortum barcoo]
MTTQHSHVRRLLDVETAGQGTAVSGGLGGLWSGGTIMDSPDDRSWTITTLLTPGSTAAASLAYLVFLLASSPPLQSSLQLSGAARLSAPAASASTPSRDAHGWPNSDL